MNPDELELVRRAIQEVSPSTGKPVTGCCEWKEQAVRIVLKDIRLRDLGLTPNEIRNLLIHHVSSGGEIVQCPAEAQEFNEEYYYPVIIPVPGLAHGLYVKLVLVDDDPDLPAVRIVSAHEQLR